MTFAHANEGEDESTQDSVGLDRPQRIMRAGRLESATPAEPWRHQVLIQPDQSDNYRADYTVTHEATLHALGLNARPSPIPKTAS